MYVGSWCHTPSSGTPPSFRMIGGGMPDEATGRPPWRALLLAGGLLLGGATLLIRGAVEMACCPQAHWAAMLFLGALAFVPGFYHSRIAYLAARGARGYSFDQLREVVV
eukprot:jgi/Tetstr1/427337/TSEL_017504.t1